MSISMIIFTVTDITQTKITSMHTSVYERSPHIPAKTCQRCSHSATKYHHAIMHNHVLASTPIKELERLTRKMIEFRVPELCASLIENL